MLPEKSPSGQPLGDKELFLHLLASAISLFQKARLLDNSAVRSQPFFNIS
jgi:hypothetical protein